MRSTILSLALLLGGAAAEAGDLAVPPFVAIPPDQAAGYRLDFARHFFAIPEQEVAARRELEDRLKRLEALRGQVARTAASLREALRLDEQVQVEARRHVDYLHLRHAVDTRAAGGFSKGFVGVDSVFFAAGFDGSYNDMRVLTHEGTHAVHRQLMTQAGVSPIYAQGPSYLFESFATFSELLLADSLATAARDPALRQFFLEQFLEGKGTVMFVAGPEAALEQAVYEGVAAGRVEGAPELDALTRQVFARYSIWPDREPELRSQWMAIPLMYEDPFYDVNYVYASLLALEYYSLYKADPQGFATRYEALLQHGFDAPPEELLQKALGIGLEPKKLVADAMRVLTAKMAEMEAAGK